MKKLLIVTLFLPTILFAKLVEASSGMAPIWAFMIKEDFATAEMSSKAEQDSYDGVTQGPVVSNLMVFKSVKECFT